MRYGYLVSWININSDWGIAFCTPYFSSYITFHTPSLHFFTPFGHSLKHFLLPFSGILTHHAAFDGKSSTMLIKSWAYICSSLQNNNKTPTPKFLSLPQLMCWLVWSKLNNRRRKKWFSIFMFSVNCRSRLDHPIPTTYFGNCIVVNRVKNEGVLSGEETWVLDMHEPMKGRIFPSAGSPWFEVFSIDFGWGRPKKVDMTSTDKTEAFSLGESRDNSGGTENGLVLSQREMEALFFFKKFIPFRLFDEDQIWSMNNEEIHGLGGPMTRIRVKKVKETLKQMGTTLNETRPKLDGLELKWLNCLIEDKV